MADNEIVETLNPAWLDSPPDADFPTPPAVTRPQNLPYHNLTWENFERLILRIARCETNVAECWIYGVRGQKQHGLDVIAELLDSPGELACYQCKRVEYFSVTDINNAVEKFLEGKWANRTRRFILCTSLSLSETKQVDEIRKQRKKLEKLNIEFDVMDGSESGKLSVYLKRFPALVDDFFGREWVRIFNGKESAESLGQRLDGLNLAELRKQLLAVYSTLFHRYDPGIRLVLNPTAPLLERYIAPTVIRTRELFQIEKMPSENTETFTDGQPFQNRPQQTFDQSITTMQELRLPIGDWLSSHNRSVILGEPGFGKSTLLRVAVLQLLMGCDEPLSIPWRGYLPIWISFGGFSAAVQRKEGLSLEDYFDLWLHQHGADSIRPLFKRAVKRKEVLLLIDGLDEGKDLYTGQRAMDLVTTFLSINPIPAIFTSRPRGYSQVQPHSEWALTRLAPFNEEQIDNFAHTWFRYIETWEVETENGKHRVPSGIERRKEDFLRAIRANPRVMDLARNPLFCQLLIDVFRFSHHLPEQRTKIYDKIIELLLSDHPAARLQAAGLPSSPNVPRSADMHQMLMQLALCIQLNSGTGAISIQDCNTVFCDFLTDEINGPGLSPYKARYQAESIVNHAQTGLGLLVERAPGEIGFFHQTVQEYLAAQAMTRRSEQDQLDWLARVWDQPRWHEVLISWFSIMGSEQGKEKTQRAIDHLKGITNSYLAKLKLLLFRTELATSEQGLTPREARITIEEAANQVETTPFPDLRKALARHITIGLRSYPVAEKCRERISNWVPARSEFDRALLLEAFSSWEPSEDLLNTLNLALHDERCRCRLAAANSIARVFAADSDACNYLIKLATNFPETKVRAAALHALRKGWSGYEVLVDLADAASQSCDMELSLIGIAIRVDSNRHNKNDRDKLWFMFSQDTVPYEMQSYCREVLCSGWSNDEYIKRLAMDSETSQQRYSRYFDKKNIIVFLAQSWEGDSEVGDYIARWFANSPESLILPDFDKWEILYNNFRGHRGISSTLRKILEKIESKYNEPFWGPDIHWAYCMIGDDAAKKKVIEAYKTVKGAKNKHWIVATLMKAWSNDSEVRRLLVNEFDRPPQDVAYLSYWISDYIANIEKRRLWLIKALRGADNISVRAVIDRILNEFHDEECLELVLTTLEKNIWYYDKMRVQDHIIEKFPKLPIARQWAEASFLEIDGHSIASVAAGYKDDLDMRKRLLKIATPAKRDVRSTVFQVFRENSIPNDSVNKLTEYIWSEENGEIRSAGVVARCMIASRSHDHFGPLINKLRDEIESLGIHYEMRRRSAFAGLLELKSYDTCAESLTKDKPTSFHWLVPTFEPDSIVAQMLVKHWDTLTEALRTYSADIQIPLDGIIDSGVAREAFSNINLRNQMLNFLKTIKPLDQSPERLSLMADLLSNSSELRSCLIECFDGPFRYDTSLEAQRIFAERFSNDEQALSEMTEYWSQPDEHPRCSENLPPYLYALSIGWPESSLLQPYLDQKKLPVDFPVHLALALSSINGNEDHALACINRYIDIIINRTWPPKKAYLEGVHKWARTPMAEVLLRRLINDNNTSLRISAIGLLAITGKLTSEERAELKMEFDDILGGGNVPCPDGGYLPSGIVTTFPAAVFRFLIPEFN